jgi:hypothetical protein
MLGMPTIVAFSPLSLAAGCSEADCSEADCSEDIERSHEPWMRPMNDVGAEMPGAG